MERSSARARIGPASIAVSSNGLSGPVWGVLKSPNPALLVAFESCSDAKISTSGMTAREYPLGNRRHGRRLDVAVVVFLIIGCLFLAGRASLRAVGLVGESRPEITVLDVKVGEPVDITVETPKSALIGFYAPEEHGAWLGSDTGYFRLKVGDSTDFRSVNLFLMPSAAGAASTRDVTVTVFGEDMTVELAVGSPQWVAFDARGSDEIEVAIRCTPAVSPGGRDNRAVCVLLSAVAVVK